MVQVFIPNTLYNRQKPVAPVKTKIAAITSKTSPIKPGIKSEIASTTTPATSLKNLSFLPSFTGNFIGKQINTNLIIPH